MENIDLNQIVNDRRAEREAAAHEHRVSQPDDKPATGRPRLRYQRQHRNAARPRHSLA